MFSGHWPDGTNESSLPSVTHDMEIETGLSQKGLTES